MKSKNNCFKFKMILAPCALILCTVYCVLCCNVWAQGLNNIGGIIEPAGMKEQYGISDMNVLESQSFATRQHRRGQETGIGGSYLDTTSVTAETTPAVKPTFISPVVKTSVSQNYLLPSGYNSSLSTPALTNESIQEYSGLGGRTNFTSLSSPALAGPLSGSSLTFQAGESVPTKHPIDIVQPVEHLNEHRTGGDSITFP